MLIESVRTFTTEEVEDGVTPRLGRIQTAVYAFGDDAEWPLDVRGLIVFPEEQGKGFFVSGEEADLGLDAGFIFSKLDIFGPDDQPVSTVAAALQWLTERIELMYDPALIVMRDGWIIRYVLRDQRRIESELEAHVKAVLEAIEEAEPVDDRIVHVSGTEDDDDTDPDIET